MAIFCDSQLLQINWSYYTHTVWDKNVAQWLYALPLTARVKKSTMTTPSLTDVTFVSFVQFI